MLEHLPSSLSTLVSELKNPYQNHEFPICHQSEIIKSFLQKNETKETTEIKMRQLTGGKGIYPYSLCDDAEIMKTIVSFPPIESFSMTLHTVHLVWMIILFLLMFIIALIVKTYTNMLYSIIILKH